MTPHHVAALLIAAMLFIVCEFSGKCSDKMADHAFSLAMSIIVGVFGHAGHSLLKGKKPDQEHGGDGK